MKDFCDDYEVCTCAKVTLKQMKNLIKDKNVQKLGELQEQTKAGTHCRFCILPQTDFGKIKKKIYCKEILDYYKKDKNG